ncbi:MAG TPA: M23 family metallopeptidase [Longimicrobium sp.]|jgi:murein DD-endopeptidase MepM/ murein hydrolase activator NlpD|uniref:M23 family metallopeptidase n=1 Tax=Longimicrobium sp. TaxID=2029185 RepID=UPI002EDB8A71
MFPHTAVFRALRGAAFVLAATAVAAPQSAQAQRLLGRPVASATSALVSTRSLDSRESALLPVPVEGIRREQLRDTYTQSRSEGRTHHAIDIHAPRGTPVIAVADGVIRKLHSGARGGLAIYLMDDDGTTRYYYAHLDGYAQGIHEGQRVERGEVIGYVGDTGNAQPGDYHLHFSVAVLDSPSRWWEGENLNPFDLLRSR